MGNFFEDLFGGGGSETTVQQNPTFTPEQQALLNQLIGKAQGGVGKAAPTYPLANYTGVTPTDQAYLDYAGTAGTRANATQTALGGLLSGKPAYDINPQATKDYFQTSILAPAKKTFTETTMPLLNESFAGPSYWSGNRANQEGKAITDFGLSMANKEADLAYQDEQARRAALENAMGRITPAATASSQIGSAASSEMGTAGTYARQIANEKIAADLQRWLGGEEVAGTSNPTYNPNNQLALALLGLNPYVYSQSTDQTAPGFLQSLMKGISGGVGNAAGTKLGSYIS